MGKSVLNANFTFLSGDDSTASILLTSSSGQVYVGTSDGDPGIFMQAANATSFCGRITEGSLATSQGADGHVITEGDMFHRLATAPLIFHFNFEIGEGFYDGSGVCSLTVKWSC